MATLVVGNFIRFLPQLDNEKATGWQRWRAESQPDGQLCADALRLRQKLAYYSINTVGLDSLGRKCRRHSQSLLATD